MVGLTPLGGEQFAYPRPRMCIRIERITSKIEGYAQTPAAQAPVSPPKWRFNIGSADHESA